MYTAGRRRKKHCTVCQVHLSGAFWAFCAEGWIHYSVARRVLQSHTRRKEAGRLKVRQNERESLATAEIHIVLKEMIEAVKWIIQLALTEPGCFCPPSIFYVFVCLQGPWFSPFLSLYPSQNWKIQIYFKTFKWTWIDQYLFVCVTKAIQEGEEHPNAADGTIPICLSFFFKCAQ